MRRILWNEAERKTIDEWVIQDASVHIEQMDDNWYAIVVHDGDKTICFSIGAKRAPVDLTLSWEEGWVWEEDKTHDDWKPSVPDERKGS